MMTKEKLADLQQQGQAAVDAARGIAEAAQAENRPMSGSEQAAYDLEMKAASAKLVEIRSAKDDLAVIDKAREISEAIGGPLHGESGSMGGGTDSRRLSFKGMGRQVAARLLDGIKALARRCHGGRPGVPGRSHPLGRVATGLRDVLPIRVHTSPEYAYLDQTTRTNAAAVVAEGAVKPTTLLGLTRVEKTLQVIAHLSEPIPRFWIQDVAALEQFVNAELEFGLGVALEAKVLADTAGASGVQSQTYSTSVLQTLRKALTKIEVAGYAPGSIVLHPTDFEGIELALASVTAIEHLSLPYDAASRRLFGTPIVTTVAATAGVGVVLGADAVVVDVVPSSARHKRRPHRAAGSGLARGPGSQREVLSPARGTQDRHGVRSASTIPSGDNWLELARISHRQTVVLRANESAVAVSDHMMSTPRPFGSRRAARRPAPLWLGPLSGCARRGPPISGAGHAAGAPPVCTPASTRSCCAG